MSAAAESLVASKDQSPGDAAARGRTRRRNRSSRGPRLGRACILLAALLQAGCLAPLENYLMRRDVEQQFSQLNTCPVDRLAVNRVAVDPGTLFQVPAPPPEIASDPDRLKLWEKNRSAQLNQFEAMATVDIRGCGVRSIYLCWQEWVQGEGARYLAMQCRDLGDTSAAHDTIEGLTVKPEAWQSLRARNEAGSR